jgi:hypothetical protein
LEKEGFMKNLIVFLFLAVLINPSYSWASFYHFDHYALQIAPDNKSFSSEGKKEPKSGLVISGAVDSDLSTNYFGVIDFVFENKNTDQWMVIKDIKISFLTPEQNQNISIPLGARFSAWSQGITNLNEYNKKKAAIIGFVLGGALMANAGSQSNRNIGAVAATISVAELASGKNYKEMATYLPPDHLLSGDLLIPPGLFIKRWLVLNSTKHKETGFVETLVIDFLDGRGNQQRYYLKLRDGMASFNHDFNSSSNSISGESNSLEKPVSGGWQTDFSIGKDGKSIFDQ